MHLLFFLLIIHAPNDNATRSAEAKFWLENAIVQCVSDESERMNEYTTSRYAEYKSDAMNCYFSEGMGEDAFLTKWSNVYGNSLKPCHNPFLIGAQDYHTIEIKECYLMGSANHEYLFKVILYDKGFEATYERDISVIEHKQSFLIDRVIEY